MSKALIVFGALLGLSNCGGSSGDLESAHMTDSAGVRIVSSTATDRPLPWKFEEVGVLVDTLGEPFLFTRVFPSSLAPTSQDELFALDRSSNEVVQFDKDLKFVRVIGRNGGGPGEVGYPSSITMQSDTVIVLDIDKDALVRWDRNGTPQSSLRFDGVRYDVTAVGAELWYTSQRMSDSTITQVLIRDSDPGNVVQSVSNKRGSPVDLKCVRMSAGTEVFSPSLNWTAAKGRVATNSEAAYVVNVYTEGKQVKSLRREIATRAPTEEDVKALYPEGFKVAFGSGRPACVASVAVMMEQFGVAPILPLIHELRMLADATIWALRTPGSVDAQTFDVFDSSGVYAGSTNVSVLHSLSNGDVLVAQKDEDSGGYTVRRMRVTK